MQRLVWGVGLTVLTLWLVWASLHPILRGLGFGQPIEKLGQWGDSFGALNALFAAFGFSAVVVTLWLQRRQIQDAQDEQHRQRFESSYFELLKLLREVRNDLRFTYSDEFVTANPNRSKGVRRGSNAFIAAWREARFYIRRAGRELTKAEVGDLYEKHIHRRYESNFGPYFRLLYTLLHRIKHDRVLTQEEKHRYGNLLRSQLTSYELAIAGLNGLSPVSKDFGDLLTEFHMLKYLPEGTRRRTLVKYYPEQAFKPRD